MTTQAGSLDSALEEPKESLVGKLITHYRPPEEPQPILLPDGEVLYFSPITDPVKLEGIKNRARKDVLLFKNRTVPSEWKLYLKLPLQYVSFIRLLVDTMDCWYSSHDLKDDESLELNERIVPEGERHPPFQITDWFKLAQKTPGLFLSLWAVVDQLQVGSYNASVSEEVDRLGESSEQTQSTVPASP